MAVALTLGAARWDIRPAYAYNCVNVVLRDAYWGRFRGIVQSGWQAAGVGTAFARSGFTVDETPSVGAIMVWPPGMYGAGGTGHVAVVTASNEDGMVLVRHENWPYGSAERSQVIAIRAGHRFVHRRTAGEGEPAAEELVPPAPAGA